jgi:hypothetical protein
VRTRVRSTVLFVALLLCTSSPVLPTPAASGEMSAAAPTPMSLPAPRSSANSQAEVAFGQFDHPERFGQARTVASDAAPYMYSHDKDAVYGGLAVEIAFGGPVPAPYGRYSLTAYTPGSDQVVVVDRLPAQTDPPRIVSMAAEVAWHVVQVLTGDIPAGQYVGDGASRPEWMRIINRSAIIGSSGGLITVLAALDATGAGVMSGVLDVAGTGSIMSDGSVASIAGADAKYLAANLADADVFFTPTAVVLPDDVELDVAVFPRQPLAALVAGTDTETYLSLGEYEQLGVRHRTQVFSSTPIVEIIDVRQAAAYLCGRTGSVEACEVRDRAGSTGVAELRPYSRLGSTGGDPAPTESPAKII